MGRVIWRGRPERRGFWFLYLAGVVVLLNAVALVVSSPGILSLLLFAFSLLACIICLYLARLEEATVYVLTKEEIRVEKGPLLGGTKRVRLEEVEGVKFRTSLLERMGGVGTVEVFTPSRVLVLRGVKDPEGVRKKIEREAERVRA